MYGPKFSSKTRDTFNLALVNWSKFNHIFLNWFL
jgi:hypothetical protein